MTEAPFTFSGSSMTSAQPCERSAGSTSSMAGWPSGWGWGVEEFRSSSSVEQLRSSPIARRLATNNGGGHPSLYEVSSRAMQTEGEGLDPSYFAKVARDATRQ